MQVSTGARKKLIFNEINITPLTDIFLVLLIIMMVVAPMMQQLNQSIKPPQVVNGSPVSQQQLTVEVTKEGKYFIESKEIPESGLVAALKAQSAKALEASKSEKSDKEGPTKNVVIRADKETRSGAVMKVFEAARDAEYSKVTIAGEKLSGDRQHELQGADTADTEEMP